MSRRRKNSSMTPVVPDLELMAKLRQEDEENKPTQETTSNELVLNGFKADDTSLAEHQHDIDHSEQRKQWQEYAGE